MKTKRKSILISIALVITLLGGISGTFPVLAGENAGAQSSAALAAEVPTLVFPSANVPITRMVYIWTAVSGATKYHVQVFKGSTRIWNAAYDAKVCASGTCLVKPVKLLAEGSYSWRVRAYADGAYKAFSTPQSFSVVIPISGFNSPFTDDAKGWTVHKGTWKLENTNYYTTVGASGMASMITHGGDFSTLTYQVKMKREGCVGCANVIAIRGRADIDADGWLKSEYTFDYTNNGLFSVWKDSNGTYTALKNWTYSSAIKQGGWNTLMVTAEGGQLKFYINGTLVWSGADSAYSSGVVGIGMYRSSSSVGDKLWVDWAQLDSDVVATSLNLEEAGIELEGGTKNIAP